MMATLVSESPMIKVTERPNGSRRISFVCEGEGRTEQAHRDKVNINSIMSRYRKTGVVPQAVGGSVYGDFSACTDYHSACEAVRRADEAFMSLPAAMRKHFDHDPHKLLAFLDNAENRQAAEDMGLIEKAAPAASESPSEPNREPAASEASGDPQ